MSKIIARTSRCSEFDHPEFRLSWDDSVVEEADVAILLEELEEAVAGGARFADGSSFRIGWVVARLRETDGGSLAVFEPDMVHAPVWWIDSVNYSLIHRRLQQSVCTSLLQGAEVSFPSTEDTALICDRFGDSDAFSMERLADDRTTSGWRFLCREEDHDHTDDTLMVQVPLYEVVVSYDPRAIPYLALPVETTVRVVASGPSISVSGEAIGFKPGSLLDSNFPTGDAS